MSVPVDPDAVSEDDLPDNWIETQADAVQEVLEEMTTVYNLEGDTIEVQFDQHSYCDSEGNYIAINPLFWDEVNPPVEGPNILRVLDDILAHEVSHYNWSDLKSKSDFSDMYPDWGEVPGHVANILEDEFVDARRMRKWYGMRSKRAYRVMLQADSPDMTPDVSEVYEDDGEVNAFLAGLHQTALYGTARGLTDAPYNLVEFCWYVEPVIERIRRQDDPNERFKLFHVVMEMLKRYVEEPDDFDEEDYEDGTGKTVSGDPDDAEPDEFSPEEPPEAVEGMMEEMVEEMMEGEDGPMPADTPEMEVEVESVEEEGEDEEAAPTETTESEDEESEDEDGSGGHDTTEDEDDEAEGTIRTDELESGEDGELDGDRPEHDIEADHAEHRISPEEMAEKELSEGVEERYDVRIDEVDKVDDRDVSRWARLIKSLNEYDMDISERKRERDGRIDEHRENWTGYKSDRRSEALKERAENAGVIRELKDGFEELVSRNVPKPARRGTRIDPYNVARRASGDMTVTELFEEEQVVETGDRCVGFATDISGSMSSGIDELKIAGAAVAKATQIIGDEFVWEAFTDRSCPDDMPAPEGRLDLRIVTGPNEDFDWQHVDSFTSCANEPTAAGVRDCFKLMQETDANEYVMIVVTDGVALVEEDGTLNRHGGAPVEQAREAVNEVRSNGVDVIGLGIGGMDDRKMEETFGGKNYRLTDINSLAGDILDLYRQQLDTVEVKR
jgi:Mg-chelatase subunit ChlD